MSKEVGNSNLAESFNDFLISLDLERIYKGKTKSGRFYSFELPFGAVHPAGSKSTSVFDCEIILFDEDNIPMVDRRLEGPLTSFFSVPLRGESKSYHIFRDKVEDAFKVIFNSPGDALRKKLALLKRNIKFDGQQVFKELVEAHNWENIDDFIENRVYPKFMVYKKIQRPRFTKGNFYNLVVVPLKVLQRRLECHLDDNYCEPFLGKDEINALYGLINKVAEKDTPFLNRINREWKLEDDKNIPEQVIYDMAFPDDDPLAKPIPLKVSDIEKRLREKKCLLSKRGIQKLCDKLHIPRDKAKTGRCPKTTK